MSTNTDPRPSVRIVAFDTRNVNHLKTVNVLASMPLDPHHSIKEYLQLTAAQTQVQHHPTFMASPTVDKTKRTIYINGYTAPN